MYPLGVLYQLYSGNSWKTKFQNIFTIPQDLAVSENSQIPRFGKVCGNLALFGKYLRIYHFFSTQV